jgi:hypothetical protein
MTISQTRVTIRKGLVKVNVSYAVEIILQITMALLSTESYKVNPPLRLKQDTPAQIKRAYKLNPELHNLK